MSGVELKQHGGQPLHQQSVAGLKVGQTGKIVAIDTTDRQKLKKLMAMGVLPGVSVRLMQNYPTYVLQMGFTQVAIDHNIATVIFVAA